MFGAVEETELATAAVAPMPRAKLNLTVRLSQFRREKLAVHIVGLIAEYHSSTEPRRANCSRWRADAKCMPVANEGARWENASQVPAPISNTHSKQVARALNQQIVSADPPFSAVARKPAAIELKEVIEEALTARLEEAKWKQIAGEGHDELGVVGNVFLRTTFEQEYKRCPSFEYDVDDQGYQDLIAAGIDPTQALFESVAKDADGAPKMFLAYKPVLVHNGTRFEIIKWEDGVILPATVKDWTKARGIGQRIRISGLELRRGVKQGMYYKDAVETLLGHPSDRPPMDDEERFAEQGIDVAAYDTAEDAEDVLYKEYECVELDWRWDANNDGEEEWCIVTVHPESKCLLRCQYLPYEHGDPRYCLLHIFKRPGELWGMGTTELIAVYQDALTAVLNQIIDSGDLQLAQRGNFFYSEDSGFEPERHEWALGVPVPVDDVRGILPMEAKPLPAEQYTLIDKLREMADLVAGTSNPGLGRETDTNKTLGEVQIVMHASNLQFEEAANRVALQWAEVFDKVRFLESQYGEGGQVEYRKTSDSGTDFRSIPAEVLRADVDLVPTGLSLMSDLQSRISQATIVQQTLLSHPLMQILLQAGEYDVALILMDWYLQEMRIPLREKIMAGVKLGLQNFQAQQAMMGQMAMAAASQQQSPSNGNGKKPPQPAAEQGPPQAAPAGPPMPGGAPAGLPV